MGLLSKLPRATEPPPYAPTLPSAPPAPIGLPGGGGAAVDAGQDDATWPATVDGGERAAAAAPRPPLPPDPRLGAPSIARHLGDIVDANGLRAFYPDAACLEEIAHAITLRVDFRALQAEWQLGAALLRDQTPLALYNIAVLADDSSSMGQGPRGEQLGVAAPRWQALRQVFDRVTRIAALFDDDGIDICFFNSTKRGYDVRPEDLDDFLRDVRPCGPTPMARALDAKLLAPVRAGLDARQVRKPVLVITLTDGAPYPEAPAATEQTILAMQGFLRARGWPEATVAYQFAQIGDDAAATDFLDRLDNHPACGRCVDTTSDFATEAAQYRRQGATLNWATYVTKMMVGAIDPSYDAQDEGDARPPAAPTLRQRGFWDTLFRTGS